MSLSRNYEMGQEQTKRKRTRSTKKAGKRSRAASKMESQRQVADATVTKLPAQQIASEEKTGQLSDSLLQELIETTHFNEEEIHGLYDQFISISSIIDADDLIDVDEFQICLGLENSSFARRIFRGFDNNGDGQVNFKEFVQGLSIFSHKGSVEEKLAFSFRLYDMDGDGSIDKNELFDMLKAIMFDNLQIDLSEEQLRVLVEHTFDEVDTNGDGQISYEEYREICMKQPSIIKALTIDSTIFLDNDSSEYTESEDEDESGHHEDG